MKKVDVPVQQISTFAGQWVVIDPKKERIIAVAASLEEIGPMVTRSPSDKSPAGTVPFSYLVPRKDEGPYILWENMR